MVEGAADESAHRLVSRRPALVRYRSCMPSVNGGALFFGTGADPTNGTVYVLGKDMPSIIKLVPAGESTASNAGGLIPDRPRTGRGGAPMALQVTAERRGRTVYEQKLPGLSWPRAEGRPRTADR